MDIEIRGRHANEAVRFSLADGSAVENRRNLGNLLDVLDPEVLDSLVITGYQASRLPRTFARLKSLRTLSFVRCHHLTNLSNVLEACTALEELSFDHCADFHDLTGIGGYPNLRCLHICSCDIFEDIPAELKQAKSLIALDISYCRATHFLKLEHLPQSLKILDPRGSFPLLFDPELAKVLRVVSLNIQDYSHGIETLMTWPLLEDLPERLRRVIEIRDYAGYDD